MDTLNKVINLVKPKDWAISIDLSDAYLHVPLFPKHCQGRCYQWKTLCFGPTSAPRVFTKIVSVVAAILRAQSIRVAIYLDDWLVVNQNKQHLILDREKCLNLLVSLGFIINNQKSSLVPSQKITYLGGIFHLDLGIVTPTIERIEKLNLALEKLCSGHNQAKDCLHLLGTMASCIDLIPNARLYETNSTSPVKFLETSFSKLDVNIPFTQHLKSHLSWWKNGANTLKGRHFQQTKTNITITTDASKLGYRGFMGNQVFQGTWSSNQSKLHINWLELKAVYLTVNHFLSQIKNQAVLIRSDNTTVVQYINKQGGTKSPQLCYLTWDLWNLVIQNNIHLQAAHIAGKMNILADQLSRTKILTTEWSLNREIVQTLFGLWGHPLIDLFASIHNRQTQIFCSWMPHTEALAVDALTISWEKMYAYAYPPICLIPKILQYMRQFHCQIILIAPQWPRRHWYADLLQFLIAYPIRLPNLPNLLNQPKTKIYHPNPQVFNLTAWLLSTEVSKQKAFLNKLDHYSQHHGEKGLKRITVVNSKNTVAVVQGKLISIQQL
jgi:hypothetical protein